LEDAPRFLPGINAEVSALRTMKDESKALSRPLEPNPVDEGR